MPFDKIWRFSMMALVVKYFEPQSVIRTPEKSEIPESHYLSLRI
jgi:hypothetical protein